MTVEQKIVRDNIKYGYDKNFVTAYNSKTNQFLCSLDLNKSFEVGLIDSVEHKRLLDMLFSNNSDDTDLARQLVSQLRTKRLKKLRKHGNTKSIKQTH